LVITKKAILWEQEAKSVGAFLEKIWIKANDISIFILAFIHRSIVNERPDYAPEHNERLEFLWDAVLELLITEKLFNDFPWKSEWELTDIRSALVRWKNLAKIAINLELNNLLFLWKWEEKTGWRNNDYILANTVEALLGAIYLDQWYKIAKKFVLNYIYTSLDEILSNNLTKDFKTLFQEAAQADFEITPSYNVLLEEWPDHNKIFEVWVYLWDKLIAKWKGSSKKKAQEDAAKNAYNITFNTK
jgi:ribonuclease-3